MARMLHTTTGSRRETRFSFFMGSPWDMRLVIYMKADSFLCVQIRTKILDLHTEEAVCFLTKKKQICTFLRRYLMDEMISVLSGKKYSKKYVKNNNNS